MRTKYAILMLLIVTFVSATAYAGRVEDEPVRVDLADKSASGSIASARYSADNRQYIGCAMHYHFGREFAICYATTATGVSGHCTASGDQLKIVATIQSISEIYFSWDSTGKCTQLIISNSSTYFR
jgi:hypothetical protein